MGCLICRIGLNMLKNSLGPRNVRYFENDSFEG